MRKRINWVACPPRSGGGYETIYNGQYFWKKQFGGIVLSSIYEGFGGFPDNRSIRHNDHRCVYCGLGLDDAVKRFKPTKKSKTVYSGWKRCSVGYCRRLTFLINGRRYWARFNPELNRIQVWNQHHGRTPIGTLPKSLISKELQELFL